MPATDAQIDAPSAGRLVIRIKLIPQEPPKPSVWRRLNGTALLILGVVAIALGWIGIGLFRTDPTPAPAPVASVEMPQPDPAAVTTKPVESPTPARPPANMKPADIKPAGIKEVLPEVSQGSLNTIRGTVRVSFRVKVDRQGNVVGATAEDRGPSRYFERVALQAAKQWTFPPAEPPEQRVMHVQFNFRRDGVTASSSPPQ